MKFCHRCKQNKELTEFAKDRSKPNGLNHKCKECDRKNKADKNKQRQIIKNMKYPSGITNTDLYTIGNRFYLNNNPYIGYYHIIDNKFFTERLPGKYSKELVQYPQDIKNNKSLDINKKYFIKKINEGFVKLIGINEYQNYINNPLYKTIEIDESNIDELNKAKQTIPEIKMYYDQIS